MSISTGYSSVSLGFDLFPIRGSVDFAKAVAMSLGVQRNAQPLGGVIADGLDPEGGAERGERTLMVICGIQIGPESGLLGDIIGLDPDRRGVTATASSIPPAT
jgi:hypothetical protein